MAIKIIKFDLPINGTKVTTLEALRDNLTDEIVSLARSGQLERWFKSRQLQAAAQAVTDAVKRHTKDKALFMALCAVLEVEVHPDDASAIFDAPPKAGRDVKGGKYFKLYEELKESHEVMREKAKNRIQELESGIAKIFTNRYTGELEIKDDVRIAGVIIPSSINMMPVKFENDKLRLHLKEIFQKNIEV